MVLIKQTASECVLNSIWEWIVSMLEVYKGPKGKSGSVTFLL